MIDAARCPVCGGAKLECLKRHEFQFPGEQVEAHLDDARYERLWILFEKILQQRDPARFASMLCNDCGLIFTHPRFTPEEFAIKYQTIQELGSVKHRLAKHPPTNLESRSQRIHSLVSSHLSHADGRPQVLDYGGASGYNLAAFRHDFDCAVLDYERWELAEGVRYLGRDLEDLPADQRFDVILLLHTLEHALDPAALLSALAQRLSDTGVLYVEVPLGCFKEWQFLREPLTHVNFFSEQSLSYAVAACGLHTLHLSTAHQWVTHGRMWCLNLVAGRSPASTTLRSPLSTRQQARRWRYYLPYLMNPRMLRRGAQALRRRLG